MASTFEGIDKFLSEKGLSLPDLEVLKPDANLYKTLAYQPKGIAIAENNDGKIFIGNSKDGHESSLKLEAFFDLAVEKNVHLALTPEYSCPWVVLKRIIADGKAPTNDALWIIGCESILPSELKKFINDTESNDIKIICEEDLLENDDTGFFDPICYMFNAEDSNGNKKLVITIQFKTHVMGNNFQLEGDNLIRGKRRYIIRNSNSSIYLVTLICSGCFDFDTDQDVLNFNNQPYLIFHPQLNLEPRNINFRKYRSDIYSQYIDPKKEIICLNWAQGSKILDREIVLSCSSIFVKSEATTNKVDLNRIIENDTLGLYYHYLVSRAGLFSFYPGEAVFYFESYKASINQAPPQFQKANRGPKMKGIYKWRDPKWETNPEVKNEYLEEYLKEEFGSGINNYFPNNVSLLNRERLLALSTGEIIDKEWTHPTKNELFKVNEDEFYSRIALFEDPKTEQKKKNLVAKYDALINAYLKNPEIFPDDSQLIDLKEGCSIHYDNENLETNVISKDGIPACVVYVGEVDSAKAKALKGLLVDNLSRKGSQIQKRVLILRRNREDVEPIYSTDAPAVSENSEKSEVSFKKTHD